MNRSIVVVGSINIDLVLRCERLPAPGETVHGSDFRSWPGGKGANQAVAAARLGAAVQLVGCVGDDVFGARALQALRDDGVDTGRVAVVAGTATGVAMITVDAAGRNAIALAAGANAALDVQRIDTAADAIAQAAMLVCQLEVPLAAVQRAIHIANAARVPVLLNPAPAAPLPDDLLRNVDILVPNEGEAALLDPRCADRNRGAGWLRERGPKRVVVTLGERGVQVADESGVWTDTAPRVTAVDTTGAGDTFVGALAAGLVEGLAFRDAVSLAQRAAAISVTRPGAMPSMPRRAELAAAASSTA